MTRLRVENRRIVGRFEGIGVCERVSLPGVKQQDRESDTSPTSNAEVKYEWS